MRKTLKKDWLMLAISPLLFLSFAHAQTTANCAPISFGFSLFSRTGDDPRQAKMIRQEFKSLKIEPTGNTVLPQGSELNVLVNTLCLSDPSRGVQTMTWLNNLVVNSGEAANLGRFRSYHWTTDRDWDFDALQNKFEQEPCVFMVSPEGRFYVNAEFSDPLSADQIHLQHLHFYTAMDDFMPAILTRPKTVIAVIDTGVDFSHPDLQQNRWKNPDEIPENGIDDDGNGYIDDWDGYNFSSDNARTGPEGEWRENRHGTHVSGLAAARMDNRIGGVGIAGVAQIMSLNVFGKNGFSRSSTLENAIRYAADKKADVINISLGGREFSRTMRAALSYAIAKGSFIVAAAGNDGIELCENPDSYDFISPAIYGHMLDGMIVTGSVDTVDGHYSAFSNYSTKIVEIAAPGAVSSVVSPMLGLTSSFPGNAYGTMAGTSMSAPIVSGAAALAISWLKAYRYSTTPARVKRILKESARQDSELLSVVESGRSLDLQTLANYLKVHYPPTQH